MLKKITPFKVSKDTLSGREEGRRVREKVLSRMEHEPIDIVLPLDFIKVKFMDFSFADEMLGKLLRRIMSRELGEKYIVLLSLNESLKENIGVALKERELVCIYTNEKGEIEILGKLSDVLKDSYLVAVSKGKITARDLVNHFGDLEINTASNRLTRLQEVGLLCKTKDEVVNGGGRQYVYEPIR